VASYFDFQDGRLAKEDKLLRLRKKGGDSELTFKKTIEKKKVRCMEEHEVRLVDDDAYVRGVLRDVLASLGHRVEAVGSGQQALERFAPEAFDLVITDLGMELSGREVVRAIKARCPDTPVILVTGWAADLDAAELRQAGVDLVLAKPFQVVEVREAVARVSAHLAGRRD